MTKLLRFILIMFLTLTCVNHASASAGSFPVDSGSKLRFEACLPERAEAQYFLSVANGNFDWKNVKKISFVSTKPCGKNKVKVVGNWTVAQTGEYFLRIIDKRNSRTYAVWPDIVSST